jgi:formate hydrogenlyase subunit 3/multisubunit Na+/H+ antiporter MnhD subunit
MIAFFLVGLPLFGAFLLSSVYRINANLGRLVLPSILAASLLLAISVWFNVASNGAYSLAMGGFPIPLGIMFYVDQFALLFICLILVTALILWYGSEQGNEKVEMLTLWLVAAGSGLMLSGDLFNIYVFYEITAIASYGLASSRAQAATFAATIRYVILGSLGSSLALLGIALVYATTGTLNLSHLAMIGPELLNTPVGLTAFTLMLVGFGVKAELFAVNTWVPEVYATATTRVAALLGGVVSKLAMVVILRLLVLIYADTQATTLLLSLGILGVLSGEFAALRSTNLRQVLAYSSIAQLGLVAIAFSIPTQAGIMAGIFLALHHAIVKSALFMLAEKWSGSMFRLVGAAKTSLVSVILFLILVLSLVGIPPLPGFWAKFSLFSAALGTGEQIYYFAVLVVMAATVVETGYFMQIARLMFQQPTEQVECEPTAKMEFVPAIALTGIVLIVALMISSAQTGLNNIAGEMADKNYYIETSKSAWQEYELKDF